MSQHTISLQRKKKQLKANVETKMYPAPPPSGDLTPYTGQWTVKEASHLLRRTTFGPSQDMISEVVQDGLSATIDTLFQNAVPSDPPVRYSLDAPHPDIPQYPVAPDPNVAFGETWVNEPPIVDTGDQQLNQAITNTRTASVYAWNFLNMMKTELNIMPKLWMFWHNHFVVADFRLPLELYQYSSLLEDFAKGNFREMTKAVTINVSMLRYLNGNENSSQAPNENYARELLELFTVGKGDLAGPGDYSTFTEQDVREISRVLTGWRINLGRINQTLESVFNPLAHDGGRKQLSERFGNATISNGGDQEYAQLIDIIFEQEAVSTNICRRMYRYFLNSEIDDDIENRIIAPMAKILRDNDYEIEPVLTTLLSSEHFFSEEAIGCMIKNPVDFILSTTKGLDFALSGDISSDHFFAIIYYVMASEQDMQVFFHPDVAGWRAYYQEPQYYRHWINTYSLPKRNKTSTAITGGGRVPFDGRDAQIPQLINVIEYVSKIPDAADPNILIYAIAGKIFSYQISEGQKEYLKEILIPGLPDFEWSVEYNDFIDDPSDPAKRTAINNKLVALFVAMLEMPEFQLM